MARARGARAAATASTLYRCLIVLLTLVSLPRHADGGVHSVMPSSGAVSGSTTAVAVIGSDFFQTPATTCKFGSVSVPGDVTDASTIACLPPASVGGAGFVRVEVSMNAQDFTSGGDVYYQYVVPARLEAAHPSGADAAGGGFVYVSSRAGPGLGGGFTPDAACVFFDGTVAVAAETRFVSSAAMACVAPALAEQPSTLVAVASGPGASTRALAGSERPFATWRSATRLGRCSLSGASTCGSRACWWCAWCCARRSLSACSCRHSRRAQRTCCLSSRGRLLSQVEIGRTQDLLAPRRWCDWPV